jgi:hypothetical protein
MPIDLELRENDRILYVKYKDPWTFAEMQTAFKEDLSYRDNSPLIMHTLISVTELRKIPPPMITTARKTPSLTHPRRGQMVVVGAMAFIQALAEAIGRLTHNSQLKFFRTEEQGMSYLRQVIEQECKDNSMQQLAGVALSNPASPEN